MSSLTENAFSFATQGLPAETFRVVRFEGVEALSAVYRFDILLLSPRDDIALEEVVDRQATLTIHGGLAGGSDLPIHGIVANLEQLHAVDRYYFYRAELRPRLWRLTLNRYCQVFLDLNPTQFVGQVLQSGGLEVVLDHEFRHFGDRPVWDFVCQYNESHYDFVSRWMELGGVYYWFDQGEQSEKIIVTDNRLSHTHWPGQERLRYAPPTGLGAEVGGLAVQAFSLQQRLVAKNVILRNYNYEKPAIDLEGKTLSPQESHGQFYHYGDNFRSQDGGAYLAGVRTEELRCRERIFHGQSQVPTLRPGYLFTLSGHFRQSFNQDYLTIRVHHAGSQARYLQSGLSVRGLEDGDALFYRNDFQCIPAEAQFRPERVTPWPRIHGTLPAKVDASGSGQYAELDDQGRYKVILPFDRSGRADGRASAWLRMATPYAGSGYGMHLPLHKGTEVLLTFVDGDPDRPTILAAVPNPQTASVVVAANQTQSRIETAAGHKLVMDDREGKESVGLFSADGSGEGKGSWLWLGHHTSKDMQLASFGNTDTLTTGMLNQIVLGAQNNVTLGSNFVGTLGTSSVANIGAITTANIGGSASFTYGVALELGEMKKTLHRSQETQASGTVTIQGGATVSHEWLEKLALGISAALTGLSATCGLLANLRYPESGDPAPADSETGWTGAGIGVGVAVAQLGTIFAIVKYLTNSVTAFRSTIALGEEGIELRTTADAANGIVLKTDAASGIVLKSMLDNYNRINGGKITTDPQGVVLEKDQENQVTGGKIVVNAAGATIEKDNAGQLAGGKITVNANGVTIQQEANGPQVSVGADVAIKRGESQFVSLANNTIAIQLSAEVAIALTNDGINFRFSQLQAGPLRVKEDGVVYLG